MANGSADGGQAAEAATPPRVVIKKAKAQIAKARGATTGPWTFPKNTLEDAIVVAKAIEDKNAGNPMRLDMLVRALGFRQTNDWRFLNLVRSATRYGLISAGGTGAATVASLEQIGRDIVAPGSPDQRQTALFEAFRHVSDFEKVETFYKGKKLPEDEFFENTLVRDFSIPRDRVATFIQVFTENLDYLRAFKSDPAESNRGAEDKKADARTAKIVGQASESGGRTFLDTCFVMMPFGQWSDLYYKDVFHPAIKEAGLEPVRADELFSTGTVIEQIWEQIKKAKLLLADLTGKNANVFYELGLAHAARKPVIFTSGALDDVPFDLRHLRVAIYDVRDPFWGEKLKNTLTTFLKNAKNEPDRSIPQPFRDLRKLDEEEIEEPSASPR